MGFAVILSCTAQAQRATNSDRSKPLTGDEQIICRNLEACADILQRHDADQFDYDVLAQEFQRLGGPSLDYLLARIRLDSQDRPDQQMVMRAQDILSRKGWRFPPQVQTQIANLWPRADLQAHKRIMLNIATPQMRDRAISTLSHSNADIALQSREILGAMQSVAGGAKAFYAPLPPALFAALTKAAMTAPSPAIVALIGTYPAAQSKGVLAGLLLSENADISLAAYEQLYQQNPDSALAAFKSALPNLKTPRQAFALSQLLQSRHVARQRELKDGFYLHLAHGLVRDEALPELAHMMAMDMIFQSPALSVKAVPNSPKTQEVFKRLLAQNKTPFASYAQGFEVKAGGNTAQFLPLIWAEILRRDTAPHPSSDQFGDAVIFTQLAARLVLMGLDTSEFDENLKSVPLSILRQGLRFDKDWRVQSAAALALGRARDKPSQAALFQLSQNHPILDVRAAAGAALAGIASGKMDKEQDLRRVQQAAKFCSVKAFDFKQDAKQLPFFEGGVIPQGQSGALLSAKRLHLQAAVPAKPSQDKSGWLAAYDINPYAKALLYYDNISGQSELISTDSIMAILPVHPTPLGTVAREFWVIERLAGHDEPSHGRIYYLKFENDKPIIWRHLELPAAPNAVNAAKDQSLQLGFKDSHPPLRLLPNGRLISGCISLPARVPSGGLTNLPN